MTESHSHVYGCYFPQNEDKECGEYMTKYKGITL